MCLFGSHRPRVTCLLALLGTAAVPARAGDDRHALVDLRTRYLLRFTPGNGKPGWRPIRVRLRRGEGEGPGPTRATGYRHPVPEAVARR